MERIFAESDLDWTMVRPPQLTEKPYTGKYCVKRAACIVSVSKSLARREHSVPSERCRVFLFRLRMKSKRLTCHAAAYVPSAGPLPTRQFLHCRTEPRADGLRPLAARRHPRPDQRLRPNWRSNFQPVRPVRSQAMTGLFATIHGRFLGHIKNYIPRSNLAWGKARGGPRSREFLLHQH